MIRLLVTSPLTADFALPLDDGQSRYLTQVMRKGVGDEVLAFNGADGEWLCAVEQVGKRFVILRTRSQTRPQVPTPDLVLLIALIKRGRLETVVEKASELGAAEVWPVITERASVERAREDRLRLIANEAAEQTGRLDTPVIRPTQKLEKLLEDWDKTWPKGRRLLFCDEAGDAGLAATVLAEEAPGPWAILIGPEGGFSPAERTRLRALPFTVPVSLRATDTPGRHRRHKRHDPLAIGPGGLEPGSVTKLTLKRVYESGAMTSRLGAALSGFAPTCVNSVKITGAERKAVRRHSRLRQVGGEKHGR